MNPKIFKLYDLFCHLPNFPELVKGNSLSNIALNFSFKTTEAT